MDLDTFQFWLVNFTAVACCFVAGWLITAVMSTTKNN